jgi:hypothetical protein
VVVFSNPAARRYWLRTRHFFQGPPSYWVLLEFLYYDAAPRYCKLRAQIEITGSGAELKLLHFFCGRDQPWRVDAVLRCTGISGAHQGLGGGSAGGCFPALGAQLPATFIIEVRKMAARALPPKVSSAG